MKSLRRGVHLPLLVLFALLLSALSAGAQTTVEGLGGSVTALASAGDYFIIGTKEKNTIVVWDSRSRQAKRVFEGLDTPPSAVAASRSAGLLASTDERGLKVRFWELESGTERPAVVPPDTVTAMAFGGNDLLLALGFKSGTVGVLDVATGTMTRILSIPAHVVAPMMTKPPGKVTGLSFSVDGRFIAAIEQNGAILLWNLADSAGSRILIRPPYSFFSIQFSDDSRRLLAAGGTYSIQISISGGKVKATMSNCGGIVTVYELENGATMTARLADEVIEQAFWCGGGTQIGLQVSVPPPSDGLRKALKIFPATTIDQADLRKPVKSIDIGLGPLLATSAYCSKTSTFIISSPKGLTRYAIGE